MSEDERDAEEKRGKKGKREHYWKEKDQEMSEKMLRYKGEGKK